MTYSVLLLSRYERKGPSSRVRHYNYIPALERAGFRVTIAPFLDNKYLDQLYHGKPRSPQVLLKGYWRRLLQIATARQYDLIWIEKEALPWLPAFWERVLLDDRPCVIDFDDPWHLRYATHWNGIVRAILGRKLEAMARYANVVTAGSPALAAWARLSQASHVVEMPPTVDTGRYPVLPPADGPFIIGWIGTPRNDKYIAIIAQALQQLHRACGARLRIIGGSEEFLAASGYVDHVAWSEDTEALELARCHVGIMPLVDGPWEQGKCGYKVIQYMAAARPAVVSPVGAVTSILVPGETGFFATSVDDWISVLGSLAADRERVAKMGLAARKRVETMYSLEVDAPKLVKLFRDVIATRVSVR